MSLVSESEVARWTPVVLALARELWVVRDRVCIMESLLTTQGTLSKDAIDKFQPGTEQQAQLDRDCESFVAKLVAGMQSR